MFDAEWGQLGTTSFVINKNIRFFYHVKEVLPMLCHVSPKLLGQENRMLQISALEGDLTDHDTINKLFLLKHLVTFFCHH